MGTPGSHAFHEVGSFLVGERRWGLGTGLAQEVSSLAGAQKWFQDTTLLMSVCSGSSGVSSIGQELSLRTLEPGRGKAEGNKTSVISHKPARALVGTTHRAESGLLLFQKRWQPWHSGHGVNGGLHGLVRPWRGVPYAEGNTLMGDSYWEATP
jgi:hypothetical protein